MNVFNDERDWPPMAQMRQIFTDCRELSIISVNRYCLCLWAIFHVYICRLGKQYYLCLEFRRHSGGVRKDFTEKGVIEIIFN